MGGSPSVSRRIPAVASHRHHLRAVRAENFSRPVFSPDRPGNAVVAAGLPATPDRVRLVPPGVGSRDGPRYPPGGGRLFSTATFPPPPAVTASSTASLWPVPPSGARRHSVGGGGMAATVAVIGMPGTRGVEAALR